jgi:hypothetical protein
VNINPNPSPGVRTSIPSFDAKACSEFLGILLDPTRGCAEIRVLEASVNPRTGCVVPEETYSKTLACWGDDPALLVQQAARIQRVSAYITVNPVNPALKNRSNRLAKCRTTTKDDDVVEIRFLFVDFDAKRPTGISSTDEERRAAWERLNQFLNDHPEIEPSAIWGCSGNGYWLLVLLPGYPNDEEHRSLIARVTDWLSARYSDDRVELDPTMKNPARVMPLVGTMKCKGLSTDDRPHRMVTMESAPGKQLVPFDLKAWAALHVPAEEPAKKKEKKSSGTFTTTTSNGPRPSSNGVPSDADIIRVASHEPEFQTLWAGGLAGHKSQSEADLALINRLAFYCGPDQEERVGDLFLKSGLGQREKAGRADYVERTVAKAYEGRSEYFEWAKPSPRPATATGNGRPRRAGEDIEDAEILDHWPRIDPKAFHGIAGELVGLVDPHTESDPVAILFQFLTAFGNMIGRIAHFKVGATYHYLNLFMSLVGLTAVGRKGTSLDIIEWFLSLADREWAVDRIQGGLVSGEGLIHHVRDDTWGEREAKGPIAKATARERVLIDAGVVDKRLLVKETEMGRVLKAMNKPENTLSDVLRQAWDTGNLRTLGKVKPAKATGAHVSIICHVTQADIRKHLSETDSANGFANRFWWLCSRRSKLLPDGGDLESENWTPLQNRLLAAVHFARQLDANGRGRRMTRDPMARKAWHAIYEELSRGRPGVLGMILSRAEPQVMRAASLYALLDRSEQIQVPHLEAAVAAWEYNEGSTRLVFGAGMGDPDAEKLLKALGEHPEGLTRSQINVDVFGRHKKANELVSLLSDLLTQGLIHRKNDQSTGGRAAERWFLGRGS